MQEQTDLIASLKAELEKSKICVYEEKQTQKKLEKDTELATAELKDIQRAERLVRVDLEQITKQVYMTVKVWKYKIHTISI